MRNAAFCLLTEPEKSSKFRAILNEKTERTLTGEEMRSILLCVSPHRQYSIKVHSDADRFREVLQLSNGFRGKTVLGQVLVSHDIEIQEPSTIVQPGVLVGLNSLLEQTGSITLPTGEIIERHPDAVVVVTTNVSYEGCRGMNQSVIDRMSLVRDVEMPTPEVMVQRAMSVTGATDEYQVSQMVQVVNDLAEYCRKNSITLAISKYTNLVCVMRFMKSFTICLIVRSFFLP